LAQGQGAVTPRAAEAARQALALGLRAPDDVALARRIAALAALERGDGTAAANELDAALTSTPGYDPAQLSVAARAELHYLRSQAYRRQGRFEDAYRESGFARRLAQGMSLTELAERSRAEQELVEKHAGRDLSALNEDSEPYVTPTRA